VNKHLPITVNIDKIRFNFSKLTSNDIEQQVSTNANVDVILVRSA
jgi:hypothetical protein